MKNEQKSIGFGFALLGTSNTNYISDEEAENIFQCIIDHGILRFDTAQWFFVRNLPYLCHLLLNKMALNQQNLVNIVENMQ